MRYTCIMCPMGCQLEVIDKDGEITVTGNTCPKGKTYGKQEYLSPVRVVTSLMRMPDGGVVSCKTNKEVPKEMIFKVLRAIKEQVSSEVVEIGDVLIANVCNTDADVVATIARSIKDR